MYTVSNYNDFVASRFKWSEAGFRDDFLHCAVGIIGELVEMCQAPDRANFKEEMGDAGFYREALSQVFDKENLRFGVTGYWRAPQGQLLSDLLHHAGSLLDLAKKVWVYNKPLDLDLSHAISLHVGVYDQLMEQLREHIGTSAAEIISENISKLLKRYPTGYSDAAAQARADKQEES